MYAEDSSNQVVVGGPHTTKPTGRLRRHWNALIWRVHQWYNSLPLPPKVRLLLLALVALLVLFGLSVAGVALVKGRQAALQDPPMAWATNLPPLILGTTTNPAQAPSYSVEPPSVSNNSGGSLSQGNSGGGNGDGGGGNNGGSSCNHSGVSGSFGHYTFAPLTINAQGLVVDAANPSCTVHLLGDNQGWWTAGTTGDPVVAKQVFDFLTQHLHYNIIRVAYNSTWWKNNPNDISYNALYRTAFTSFIHEAEQYGLYVELDLDSQFVLPPCDIQHPKCSQASQGAQDWDDPSSPYYHDPSGQELSPYQPTALWTLHDLAGTFKDDPAILFDVWNEPANSETKMPAPVSNPTTRVPISEDTFFTDMKQRVDAVENVTQDHVVVVYVRALNDMMPPSSYPVFTEKNIMYDNHIYKSDFDQNALAAAVSFAHSHHQAYVVGEWGGAPGQPDPATFLPLLRASNVNSTYFSGEDLYDGTRKNPTSLNAIGQAVKAQYDITFGQ